MVLLYPSHAWTSRSRRTWLAHLPFRWSHHPLSMRNLRYLISMTAGQGTVNAFRLVTLLRRRSGKPRRGETGCLTEGSPIPTMSLAAERPWLRGASASIPQCDGGSSRVRFLFWHALFYWPAARGKQLPTGLTMSREEVRASSEICSAKHRSRASIDRRGCRASRYHRPSCLRSRRRR